MSAKRSELSRIQEIYDVVCQTLHQVDELGWSAEKFVSPKDAEEDLVSEGLMNRVFRVAEESGHIGEATAGMYGFEAHAARGVRNRLAHAYGDVDREIVWNVIDSDFPKLKEACEQYAADNGLDLVEQ
ncbi:HepT-like ribonuclease domain-containing protein [Curtanaerobium respiraculi]|uniref:HepT-like ribonuclease domain-containing protein n=1 Tax=Curtanaerobium respiraculi TaxID=2949669 RepID=UPI0024B34F42|nr:HepT-like ribonuclease domain-containing protein [Curtanaerobium respiraculi]